MSARLIHSYVYDPARPNIFLKAKATDHAEHTTIRCDAADRCEMFAAGTCAALRIFSGCMHGDYRKEIGPAKRAKSCRDWCREHEAVKAENAPLQAPASKLARVGDYVWVPYAHADYVLTGKHVWTTNWRDHFVKAEDFTVELVVRLAEARPRSMMGDEITAYQREEVPKFVTHLSEVFPDLAREAAERSPRIRTILASITKVGRKALLRTILPNVGLLKERASDGAAWAWDGTTMSTTTRVPFVPFNPTEVRVVPGPDAVVIITDDAQVGPDTVFVD